MGSEQQSTTQRRDLVLAIWPDYPRYEISRGYKDMPLPSFLEVTVLQLEREWKVSFVLGNQMDCSQQSSKPEMTSCGDRSPLPELARQALKCLKGSGLRPFSIAILTTPCGLCLQYRFHHLFLLRTSNCFAIDSLAVSSSSFYE